MPTKWLYWKEARSATERRIAHSAMMSPAANVSLTKYASHTDVSQVNVFAVKAFTREKNN